MSLRRSLTVPLTSAGLVFGSLAFAGSAAASYDTCQYQGLNATVCSSNGSSKITVDPPRRSGFIGDAGFGFRNPFLFR